MLTNQIRLDFKSSFFLFRDECSLVYFSNRVQVRHSPHPTPSFQPCFNVTLPRVCFLSQHEMRTLKKRVNQFMSNCDELIQFSTDSVQRVVSQEIPAVL